MFAGNRALADRLHGADVEGYVSGDAIDVRVGGPRQARYDLSQFAHVRARKVTISSAVASRNRETASVHDAPASSIFRITRSSTHFLLHQSIGVTG